ncbi:hypothetical protein RHI63_06065 [Thermosynechococcus sp. GLH187]|nr:MULTISPECIES: hypothetical protein [unclassified Thermosynechococcus]QSF50302.1 hypothetical protein JW907_06060 [Thermosynechococcus sp. TA-1]WNC33666.1 hypothetical protein RHH81_06040 [Thermosynechococcus sp. PKX95]WNC36188.1 hypothetical protein RHH79_06035 [Thermosynechococcus sp. PKX91]WNC45536.1 hypothetical protein RHI63_02145 [Thermosynechococcus sp. GLH187]WNC46282.1 hypothetical protein RHI63_06065 [Thermosynechococcus sp. GLH187]
MPSEYIIPADAPYPSFNVQCQRFTQAKQFNPDLASVNAQASASLEAGG